jgi:hypothetical protein
MKHLLILFLLQSAFGADENRRRLAPEASIIDELNDQLNEGISHPRFAITALFNDGDNSQFTENTELFRIDVVMANPSVSERTSISGDGFSSLVKNPIKLLVADHADRQSNDFAILAVDEEHGSVSGIVQKDNKFVKLEQRRNERTIVMQLNFDSDEDWECMLENDYADHDHVNEEGHNGNAFKLMASEFGYGHDGHNLRQLFNSISEDIKFDNRDLYATDTFPNAWSYQVSISEDIKFDSRDLYATDIFPNAW